MTIFGVDTARFQPMGTYDPGAFEIVNIEDPQFEAKTARNLAEGRPTGYYPWIYPGTDVGAFTRWAIGKARAAGSNFGAWADYEQDGVTLDLLDQFFASCDAASEPAGYYGNDFRFGHGPYLARPYWYAGYPDPNDGQWRDGYAPRASRPVQLFQFTSGGGLDRNVVWDESWFANWVHGTSPAPQRHTEEDDVLYMLDKDGSTILRMGTNRRPVVASEWNAITFKYKIETGLDLKPFPFDQAWHDSLFPPPVNAGDIHNIGEEVESRVRKVVADPTAPTEAKDYGPVEAALASAQAELAKLKQQV